MFGDQLLMPYFEERAAVQQSTGAARPIHSWPAEGASEIAKGFDWLLAGALSELSSTPVRKVRAGVVDRSIRGQSITEMVEVEEVPSSRRAEKKRRWFSFRKSS